LLLKFAERLSEVGVLEGMPKMGRQKNARNFRAKTH